MISSSVARRYATALFELAGEQNKEDVVSSQLHGFSGLMKAETELERALTNPTIPPVKKLRIFEELEKSLELDVITSNFIKLLIKKGRIDHLEAMGEEYDELERQRKGIVVVEISTAKKLKQNEEEDLRQKLEGSTGKKVELKTFVKPELIGGMVARIGSTIYDGSLDHQLALIQQRLGEE